MLSISLFTLFDSVFQFLLLMPFFYFYSLSYFVSSDYKRIYDIITQINQQLLFPNSFRKRASFIFRFGNINFHVGQIYRFIVWIALLQCMFKNFEAYFEFWKLEGFENLLAAATGHCIWAGLGELVHHNESAFDHEVDAYRMHISSFTWYIDPTLLWTSQTTQYFQRLFSYYPWVGFFEYHCY